MLTNSGSAQEKYSNKVVVDKTVTEIRSVFLVITPFVTVVSTTVLYRYPPLILYKSKEKCHGPFYGLHCCTTIQ